MANGLFATPEQIRAAEQAQFKNQFLQGGSMQAAAANLGNSLGKAGSRGLFDVDTRSDAEKRSTMMQGILQDVDVSDRESLVRGVQALSRAGLQQEAFALKEMIPQQGTPAKPSISFQDLFNEEEGKSFKHMFKDGVDQGPVGQVKPDTGAAPKTKTLYVNGKPVVAQHNERADVWTFNDGNKNFAYTTQQLGANGISLVPPDTGAPTRKTRRDGNEIVYEDWNKEQQRFVEVGRGDVREQGSGNASQINLYKAYEKRLKDDGILSQQEELTNIKQAAKVDDALSRKFLQTALANMAGGQTRAVSELNRFKVSGSLPQRIADSAVDFFTGTVTDESRKAALRFAYVYERDVLRPKWEAANAKFTKMAEAGDLDAGMIIRPLPVFYDFEKMNQNELLSLADNPGFLNNLDIFQTEAMNARLDELIQ